MPLPALSSCHCHRLVSCTFPNTTPLIFLFHRHHCGPSDDNYTLILHTPKFNFSVSFRSTPTPINISGCGPVTYVHKSKNSCCFFPSGSQLLSLLYVLYSSGFLEWRLKRWRFPSTPSLVAGPVKVQQGYGLGKPRVFTGPWSEQDANPRSS